MTRGTFFIIIAVLLVLALAGYSAHGMNLMGMIRSMHTPPGLEVTGHTPSVRRRYATVTSS